MTGRLVTGRRLRIVAAALSWLAAAGCSSSAGSSAAGSSPAGHGGTRAVNWDLRKGSHIADLGIPKNTTDIDDADVSITLPGGQVFTGQHVLVMVDGDLKDPTLVVGIRLGLGKQTVDEAYQTASAFGKTWGFPADQIQGWYAEAKKPASYNAGGAGSRELAPGGPLIQLYMAESFDSARPVLPEFVIDGLGGARVPASAP